MVDKVKKVVAINDMSGIGRCSLTIAIPILSALRHQCCPFPTAILSCQTAYDEFSFLDFTGEMEKYKSVWEKLNIDFHCIYSGFLGSKEQIKIVSDFINLNKEALIVVDPVMGDNGELYSTYTADMCAEIRKLVTCADVITPNLTEACILLGIDFESITISENNLKEIVQQLSRLGPKKIVITGIKKDHEVWNFAYEKNQNKTFIIKSNYCNKYYGGTGDIFASILTGMLLRGFTFKESIEKATKFIYKAIEFTSRYDTDPKEGIIFEPFLKELIV